MDEEADLRLMVFAKEKALFAGQLDVFPWERSLLGVGASSALAPAKSVDEALLERCKTVRTTFNSMVRDCKPGSGADLKELFKQKYQLLWRQDRFIEVEHALVKEITGTQGECWLEKRVADIMPKGDTRPCRDLACVVKMLKQLSEEGVFKYFSLQSKAIGESTFYAFPLLYNSDGLEACFETFSGSAYAKVP